MKRDLPAAIIISLVLHAVLLGALHLVVLPTGRDAAFAGAAPIRVVMGDRRGPDGAGARRAPESAGSTSGSADAARTGTPGDAGARGPGTAPDSLEGGDEPDVGPPESDAAPSGDAAAGDEVSGEAPAEGSRARNTSSAEKRAPAETRAARPPRLASLVDPEYPFRARRLGHEGTVAFTVLVRPGGAVLDITLDEAAHAAVSRASYTAGSSRDPMRLRVRVVFELEGETSGP